MYSILRGLERFLRGCCLRTTLSQRAWSSLDRVTSVVEPSTVLRYKTHYQRFPGAAACSVFLSAIKTTTNPTTGLRSSEIKK
jgi:hypothetical protein